MPDIAEMIHQIYVLNMPAIPTTMIVTQGTPADLKSEVYQPIAASLKCEPVQTDSAKLIARTQELGCGTLAHAIETVLVPGTPVRFNAGASLVCKAVMVRARPTVDVGFGVNLGAVYIGNVTVDIAAGWNSVWLAPGESITIPVANVNMVYVDADNANDAVAWLTVIQ